MKGRSLRTVIGLSFVLLLAILFFFSPLIWVRAIQVLEDDVYDFQLRHFSKKIEKKDNPIVIIDIDDQSLQTEGRWPWPRKTLARLTNQLYELGASVIAFDLVFSEEQKNFIDELLPNVPEGTRSELETIKPLFDYDLLFAKSLEKGDSILGFVLKKERETQGALPTPILTLSQEQAEELHIPNWEGYLSNIPLLQKAAKSEAFLNAAPDPDGVNRKAFLILRYGKEVFPSLALEAARSYLLLPHHLELITADYAGKAVLEGIRLGDWTLQTNAFGQVLIPFYGPPYSFPYVSASDVLEGRVSKNAIEGKLVLIGSTATAIGDHQATPLSPTFPGVEAQANLVLGIFLRSLLHTPSWGRGVSIFFLFVFGIMGALLFPRLGPIASSFLFLIVDAALIGTHFWIWKEENLVFSFSLPLLGWGILYAMNLIVGYFFEKTRSRHMKELFSQYLPKERIDLLMKSEKEPSFEGESKELSVLFADIRNFTAISETKSASETKQFLNLFFTPMTELIFQHKGTIDKYVGDMIMAFWGAPLEDPNHPLDALSAAWDMQQKLRELNQGPFKDQKWPEIQIGIGINTGMMNVGDMGSQFRRAYTVLGDAVNLASRLEGLTKYYGSPMIVGPKTHESAQGAFLFRHLDKVRVKGKREPLDIYEVLGPKGQELPKHLEMYQEALQAYFSKKWETSRELFQQLLSLDPLSEKLYHLYLQRIENFLQTPPPENWDGAYTFEQK